MAAAPKCVSKQWNEAKEREGRVPWQWKFPAAAAPPALQGEHRMQGRNPARPGMPQHHLPASMRSSALTSDQPPALPGHSSSISSEEGWKRGCTYSLGHPHSLHG